MAITVNTNVASLNAQKNLIGSQNMLNRSLERLSSGLRVNSAKDDAAGLAISDRMTSQIRGLNQAVRNANDGISMAQTAEGAMGEITNNLQRIRELAIQSANASNTATDRASLNAEVTQLVAEIDRTATTTSFNGNKVLSGTFTSKTFQIGSEKGETLSFSIASMRADSLGVGSGSSYAAAVTGSEVEATALSSGDMTINGYEVGAATADGVSYSTSSASGIAVANAINAVAGDTNVTATVNATTVAGTANTTAATALAAGDILINGVDVGALAAQADWVVRASDMAAAVNAISNQTGVTATFATTGSVSLTAADGRNITITTGANTASAAANTGLGFGDALTTLAADTTRSTVDLSSTDSAGITLGGAVIASAGYTAGSTAATSTAGAGVSSVDISTVTGAEDTLAIIDAAIERVDTERGNLGAVQNRMESTIANLLNVSQNISAARGRIVDADFAAETANLTKSQILQQAGMAMLSQANAIPQGALTLLQG
jgi:flagellin